MFNKISLGFLYGVFLTLMFWCCIGIVVGIMYVVGEFLRLVVGYSPSVVVAIIVFITFIVGVGAAISAELDDD